jgi:hypothetical protein
MFRPVTPALYGLAQLSRLVQTNCGVETFGRSLQVLGSERLIKRKRPGASLASTNTAGPSNMRRSPPRDRKVKGSAAKSDGSFVESFRRLACALTGCDDVGVVLSLGEGEEGRIKGVPLRVLRRVRPIRRPLG